MQHEDYSSNRKGERQYLSKPLTKDMMKRLNSFFENVVEIPRIRHGNRQTVETLINEEALLLAKFLRYERETWVPRLVFNLDRQFSGLLEQSSMLKTKKSSRH